MLDVTTSTRKPKDNILTHSERLLEPTGPVMKGDSYSSRRLFSLLFAGTIPVIICDFCMLPYQDMLDYSKFVVFLPESEVLDNPDYDIFDVLDAIPQSELDRLRHNGRIVKKHFVFHEGKPLPGDAFDMMVCWNTLIESREFSL